MTNVERIQLELAFEFVQTMNADRATKIDYFVRYIKKAVHSPTKEELDDYIRRIR